MQLPDLAELLERQDSIDCELLALKEKIDKKKIKAKKNKLFGPLMQKIQIVDSKEEIVQTKYFNRGGTGTSGFNTPGSGSIA